MTNPVRRSLAFLVPSATVATLACLLVAVVIQQDLRRGADDPQDQLAEDAVARLDAGAVPTSVIGTGHVDIAVSLAPFVAVYDANGTILATDGALDGAAPAPPPGVLATARATGLDTVTWQPRSGVRVALVVRSWSGGTVLAGRSLRRIEAIEAGVEGLVLFGWLSLLGAALVAALVSTWLWPHHGDATGPPDRPV